MLHHYKSSIMLSTPCRNCRKEPKIMKTFLNLIFLIFLAVSCIEAATGRRRKCKHYTKSSSKYDDWDCGAENDYADAEKQADGILKYGHTYKGVGRMSTPEECARPCTERETPKNCYYKFTVEIYRTFGRACDLCRPTTNTSIASDCECVEADGVDHSGKILINRQTPGPSINVCIGDMVIIDVINRAAGSGVTLHWHGLYQYGWQYYDGTPFITQCPIHYGATFRYKWRAQNSGTHFYHAHTGFHQPDGMNGALIIREPHSRDPNKDEYDEDRFDTVMMMQDWMHTVALNHWPGTTIRHVSQQPDNILINGKGQWFNETTNSYTDVPLATYNVEPNRRYRFRMINSFSWVCSVRVTIQGHQMRVIAADGEDVKPIDVDTIVTSAAERFDFVVNTNREISAYWIEYRLIGDACTVRGLVQVAVLRYIGSEHEYPLMERPYSNGPSLPSVIVLNDLHEVCGDGLPNKICIKDLESAEPVDKRISAKKADVTIFLPVDFYSYTAKQLFAANTYKEFEAPTPTANLAATVSNIVNVLPSSPYLTQFRDIPPDTICDDTHKPDSCDSSEPCHCAHLIRNIPMNSLVEIIMLDLANNGLNHPFHLHGYGYHVLAQGKLNEVPLTEKNKYDALKLHAKRYGKLNKHPPVKDTLSLGRNGYTIVRFIADNPGFWLFHCHFNTHHLSGMELALQVGNWTHLPVIPADFPKCGSYLPPT